MLIYWAGITILNYSALRSNSAFRFFIISALWSKIRPSGFLMIRPSGFGLTVQSETDYSTYLCILIQIGIHKNAQILHTFFWVKFAMGFSAWVGSHLHCNAKLCIDLHRERNECKRKVWNEQELACLIFCSQFVVDKLQTKILSSTSVAPIWFPNERLRQIHWLYGINCWIIWWHELPKLFKVPSTR